ncbi:MAG: OsmC family peroxiredoxin [Saprospiraceae bacterium]|jgi:osmotically inducible protein OsmC|nr:OsmC family peroxiredoxin [Saprospiraceae bacterium]MCO5277038.1 OsmC family peroxiredoxin [Saprospiraceae bacterium]
MKIIRRASAEWKGTGKEGVGHVSTKSKALDSVPYNFEMRFGDKVGTNPEELIGAAHASCFSMKLSFVLNEMGYTADHINTIAAVTLEEGRVSHILLSTRCVVQGISKDDFTKAAIEAKQNCPISLLFNTEIELEAELITE